MQVHSNFQFTPELASSHREWSFSTAILINQGSSSQGKTSGCQTPQTPQTYPKQFHQTASQDPHSESSPGNVLVSVNNSGFPQACLPWYSPVSCKECWDLCSFNQKPLYLSLHPPLLGRTLSQVGIFFTMAFTKTLIILGCVSVPKGTSVQTTGFTI